MSQTPNKAGAAIAADAYSPPLMPRRFKWLRRFGVAAAGVVVGTCLLRVIWGVAARHRLDTQLEQYRAANQPVYVGEFDAELDAVDQGRNAAILIEKAMETLVATSESGVGIESFLDDAANFKSNMSAAHELMEANAEPFRLLREARNMPDVAWSSRLGTPEGSPARFRQQRLIAKLLWFATAYHFRNGNHGEAVAVLRDYQAFNNVVDSEPTLISSLVAWAAYNLSFALLEEFLDGLQISHTTTESPASISGAPRQDVESLLRELLAEESMRRNVVRSHYGSRASTLHSLETKGMVDWVAPNSLGALSGSPWRQIINVMVRPVLVLDTARAVRYDTMAAAAANEETWSEASRHFVPETVSANLLRRVTRPITCTQFGSGHSSSQLGVQLYFKILARRRMAAVAVAIHLFELDHGRRPSQLAGLTPTYLAELPQDPFATSARSFGYLPHVNRPLLYSVGLDGKDNEGKQVRRPDGKRDRERSDIVFYLEPEPMSSSTDEADDDEQNVEHEQGKEAEEENGKSEPYERQRGR